MKKKAPKVDTQVVDVELKTIVKAVTGPAVMSEHEAGGRLVPVVHVDTAGRADIEELISIHRYVKSGDVTTRWATLLVDSNRLFLVLNFIRPVRMDLSLEFSLSDDSAAVDLIMQSRAFYLVAKSQSSDDTFGIKRPRILIDVPWSGFEHKWEEIYRKIVETQLRGEGLKRRAASLLVDKHIEEMRRMMGMHVFPSHGGSD